MTSYLTTSIPFKEEELPASPRASSTPTYATSQECPLGQKYRNPSFVPGSCIKNRKNSIFAPDERCPEGMHWKDTKFRPGKCVKVPLKKPRKRLIFGAPIPKTQCNSALIDALFEDHLKVVRSYLRELFTVPISKDFFVQSKFFDKIYKKFLTSLKKASKQTRCILVIPSEKEKRVRDLIIQEVYALNRDLITDEQWAFIKKMAELDVFLHEANLLVKSYPFLYKFTTKYSEKLLELREGLLYMRQHHLLPKQNLLVAEAVYEYILQFKDVESLHVLNGHNKFVPKNIQQKNSRSLNLLVVQKGFVSTNVSFYYTERPDPLPDFLLPGEIREEAPPVFEKEEVIQSALTLEPVNGLSPMTNEELLELYDLSKIQYFFMSFQNEGALLLQRGQDVKDRFDELSDKFRATYNDDGTKPLGPWYLVEQHFLKQNYSPTLQQLEVKYSGPFWILPMTAEEANELIELNFLFKAFKNTPNVQVNARGRELEVRFNQLKQKLYTLYQTSEERKRFLQTFNKNFVVEELIRKYGTFWEMLGTKGLLTEEEMRELFDLQVIHTLFLKKGDSVLLTERGQELEVRRDALFEKLSGYFDNTKSTEELVQYLQNYSSEYPVLGLEALVAKYGGPFWGSII